MAEVIVARLGFKGFGFVSIVASEEMPTEKVFRIADNLIRMTRDELEAANSQSQIEEPANAGDEVTAQHAEGSIPDT